jgi:hypothetical protein
MRKFSLLFFLSPFFASAQSDSSFLNQKLIAVSSENIGENIYNGRQHLGYPTSIIGNPYYQTGGWQQGSIIYHDIFYPKVSLRYDLVQNEVIIRNNKNDIAISLFTPRIKSFTISGKKFFYSLGNDRSLPPAGIYEETQTGVINFYIHRSRYIKEMITGLELTREFVGNDLYYAIKDGVCYPIYKPKDILHLFKERKNEVKKDLKNKGLRFRSDPEAALTEMIAYYNKTTR